MKGASVHLELDSYYYANTTVSTTLFGEQNMQDLSNDASFFAKLSAGEMKLLPCFEILEFNLGLIIHTAEQEKNKMGPEELLYRFNIGDFQIC